MPRLLFVDFGAIVALLAWILSSMLGPMGGVARAPVTMGEEPAVVAAMKADLSARLQINAAEIVVVSYEEVTWPDACLGVTPHGRVCGQVLVPGFMARFETKGRVYRYHGSGDSFIAASFARDATIGSPVADSVAIEGLAITGIEP